MPSDARKRRIGWRLRTLGLYYILQMVAFEDLLLAKEVTCEAGRLLQRGRENQDRLNRYAGA